MGLFSWFGSKETISQGVDTSIPEKNQCYHIVGVKNNQLTSFY
jgi:hypothetical protein